VTPIPFCRRLRPGRGSRGRMRLPAIQPGTYRAAVKDLAFEVQTEPDLFWSAPAEKEKDKENAAVSFKVLRARQTASEADCQTCSVRFQESAGAARRQGSFGAAAVPGPLDRATNTATRSSAPPPREWRRRTPTSCIRILRLRARSMAGTSMDQVPFAKMSGAETISSSSTTAFVCCRSKIAAFITGVCRRRCPGADGVILIDIEPRTFRCGFFTRTPAWRRCAATGRAVARLLFYRDLRRAAAL